LGTLSPNYERSSFIQKRVDPGRSPDCSGHSQRWRIIDDGSDAIDKIEMDDKHERFKHEWMIEYQQNF